MMKTDQKTFNARTKLGSDLAKIAKRMVRYRIEDNEVGQLAEDMRNIAKELEKTHMKIADTTLDAIFTPME